MKGTIDLVIKIDGAKVETLFSMRDGVEDMDIDVVDQKRISENCPTPPKTIENKEHSI